MSNAKRGPLPEIVNREFEIGWTSATLFLFGFLFWWASSADIKGIAAPANALEVHVVAKQWMWKTQHSNGAREINALHVPVDQPVRLVLHDMVVHLVVAGCHPLFLRSGFPGETRCTAWARHLDLVSSHKNRRIPAALR